MLLLSNNRASLNPSAASWHFPPACVATRHSRSPRGVPGEHRWGMDGHNHPHQWWAHSRYQYQQSTHSLLCWPEISPSSGLLDARKPCLHPSEQTSYWDNKARALNSHQWSLIFVQDRLQLAIPNTVLMEQNSGVWSPQTKERFQPKRLHSEAGTGICR